MGGKCLHGNLDSIRMQHVITAKHDKDVGIRPVNAFVGRFRLAAIWLADESNRRERADNVLGAVGRSSVDDEDLDIAVGLIQRALQRLTNEPGVVSHGQDDADLRFVGRTRSYADTRLTSGSRTKGREITAGDDLVR